MSEFNVGTMTKKINANIYPIGPQGPKGDTGEKGEQGYFYTPSVSEDGVLSWINNGDLPNPPSVNIKGEKGDKGETGATGPSNIEKIKMLSQQMPWNTTSGESIHIQDASEWDENKLSLSGNMKQEKRSGKNKLDIKNRAVASKTVNGIAYTKNADGTFNLSGTVIDTANAIINIIEDLKDIFKKDTSYYFYCSKTYNLTTFNISIEITYTDNTTQNLIANKVTKTQNKEIKSVRLPFWAGKGTTIDTATNVKLMLVESTVIDNDYEEYGAMPSTEFPSMPVVATGVQKIRQFGKNVCKITSVTGYNYISSIPTKPGKITINFDGNSMSIKSTENAYRIALTNIIQLLPNTKYTLSYTRTNNLADGGSARRYIYDYSEKDGYTLINALNSGDDGKMSYTFTTDDSGAIALAWGYNNTASGSSSVIYDIQIEKGSVATGYEPCAEEINTLDLGSTELCAIKDANGTVVAQDRAVYRNGKWQWEKNVGKYVFNGTESWSVDVKQSGCNYYSFFTKPGTIKAYSNIVANLFKEDDTIYATDNLGIYVNYVGAVRIKNGVSTTVAELKAWLSTNNLIAYYVLATPTYTDCTADQSAILDKLYNNFKLQKGVNDIIVETDNGVGVNMELTYMQDLQTKLNLLEAMCVSNASQEV